MTARSRRALVLAVAILAGGLVWLSFRAYHDPELLLGVVNLRYCN